MAVIQPLAGYSPILQLRDEKPPADAPPDDRSGSCYAADATLQLATEVALASGRPLLLRGSPGTGKSSWAPYVARNLGWSYHEFTVTTRDQADALFARFDAVKRLQDAQLGEKGGSLAAENYVTPGPLWWAFDFHDAAKLATLRHEASASKRKPEELPAWNRNADRDATRAVVLIDELDKADPALPNDLLEAISLRQFHADRVDRTVTKQRPDGVAGTRPDGASTSKTQQRVNKLADLLIVFTSNDERDLPQAFLRRCVVHRLRDPDARQLERIAWLRRGRDLSAIDQLAYNAKLAPLRDAIRIIAEATVAAREQLQARSVAGPNTAEFLDLVTAWEKLGFDKTQDAFGAALKIVLSKTTDDGAGITLPPLDG